VFRSKTSTCHTSAVMQRSSLCYSASAFLLPASVNIEALSTQLPLTSAFKKLLPAIELCKKNTGAKLRRCSSSSIRICCRGQYGFVCRAIQPSTPCPSRLTEPGAGRGLQRPFLQPLSHPADKHPAASGKADTA